MKNLWVFFMDHPTTLEGLKENTKCVKKNQIICDRSVKKFNPLRKYISLFVHLFLFRKCSELQNQASVRNIQELVNNMGIKPH